MPKLNSAIIIPPSPFLDSDRVFPQLGPLYIKRYVEEHSGYIVDVLDDPPYRVKNYDIIGFSCTTPQYDAAKVLAKGAKKTVVGGPHCAHYDVGDFSWDYVIKHDGCKPFLNILNGKEPGNELDDPDQLPYRDESLHKYKYFLDGNPTTVIMGARGCPNHCYFCENGGTAVRLKSANAIHQEIDECVKLGFTGINFFDDLFCLNMGRVKKLCDIIKPFHIKFRAFAHARNFSRGMAALLADAGCVEIGYGAEHATQRILDGINKKTTVEQNYNIIKIAHEFGIRVKAFTMIGLPGETWESVKDLKEFIEKSGADQFDVTIFYPYKGTYIADHPSDFDLKVESVQKDEGFFKGKQGSAVCKVSTSAMTAEEIQQAQKILLEARKK